MQHNETIKNRICPFCVSRWAYNEGQDFLADHSSPNIDFAAFHHWPDNWLDNSTAFETGWMARHITDAARLKKPVGLPTQCCSIGHASIVAYAHLL